MEQKVARAVDELMPGCNLTTSLNLAIRLRLFLDANYYVMQSLMVVLSFNDLKIEEVVLNKEFGYPNISHARANFRRLVLI